MRKVAWTGTKSRYVEYSDGTVGVDHDYETQRDIPFWYADRPGAIKSVGRRDGLSKDYVFGAGPGPESFIQEMEDEDAEKLLRMQGEAQNFQDVTHDDGFFERFYRPLDEILSNG